MRAHSLVRPTKRFAAIAVQFQHNGWTVLQELRELAQKVLLQFS